MAEKIVALDRNQDLDMRSSLSVRPVAGAARRPRIGIGCRNDAAAWVL